MMREVEVAVKFDSLLKRNFELYMKKGKFDLEEFKFNKKVLTDLKRNFDIIKVYYRWPCVFKVFGQERRAKRQLALINSILDILKYNFDSIEYENLKNKVSLAS